MQERTNIQNIQKPTSQAEIVPHRGEIPPESESGIEVQLALHNGVAVSMASCDTMPQSNMSGIVCVDSTFCKASRVKPNTAPSCLAPLDPEYRNL